jgi:putative ABC transport system permease protein
MNRLPGLAIRNVGRNRRRTVITALTILFGVAMVVTVRGMMWGLQSMMISDTVEGRLGALQIHKAGYLDNVDSVPLTLNLPYDQALLARVRKVPHVTGVTGRIQFNGLVSNGLAQTMFVGRGLDMDRESTVCPRVATTVKEGGAPLAAGDDGKVLVGFELGQSFGVEAGKSISLQTTSPSGRANSLDLTVKGLSTSAFPMENKRVVTVTLATAQALLGMEGRVTELAVSVDDLERLDVVAQALRVELGPEYEVHGWSELQPFLRDIIARQNFVLGAVALVLLVIVLTSIVNTMLMSVFERVREIGTLLAVGVRRAQVMSIFIIEAAVIGVLGGLGGALAGRTIVAVVASLGVKFELSGLGAVSVLRPSVTWAFVGSSVLVALVAALGASLWPAWRASRMNPVDALRN